MKMMHLSLLSALMLPVTGAQASNIVMDGGEVTFTGRLVEQPCEVDTDSKDILVDFGDLNSRDLLQNGKSETRPFTINLLNCSTATANTVTVTFSGDEDSELSGRLNLTGEAEGVAVRLLDDNGGNLDINSTTQAITLENGSNSLGFSAYVEKYSAADALTTGDFTGVAAFTLSYQ